MQAQPTFDDNFVNAADAGEQHTLLTESPEASVHATVGQSVDNNLFSANIVAPGGDVNGVSVLSELQHCNIEIQGHA